MDNKKISKVLACVLFLAICVANFSIVHAGERIEKLISKIQFLSSPKEISTDNGVTLSLIHPIIGWRMANLGKTYYTTSQGLLNIPYTATINGVVVYVKNMSQTVAVIRWAESDISIGDYSGIPFLANMKYKDAGNPSATPDTVLAPGKTISKEIYISRVEFVDSSWQVIGVPVNKDNSSVISVILKLSDEKGKTQYVNLTSPSIGISPSLVTPTK